MNELLKILILVVILFTFLGLRFWPETYGRFIHIQYNAFMIGWDSVK